MKTDNGNSIVKAMEKILIPVEKGKHQFPVF